MLLVSKGVINSNTVVEHSWTLINIKPMRIAPPLSIPVLH